jgi:hypothetical protein
MHWEEPMAGDYVLATVERHGDGGLECRSITTYRDTYVFLFLDEKRNTPNPLSNGLQLSQNYLVYIHM